MVRNSHRKRAAAAIALAALLLPACGTTIEPYAGPGLATRDRRRMAILPFENLSKAPGAAKTLEGMVLVEFLKRARISIVDPGEVAAALSKQRVRIATSMSREALVAVARDLDVDLLLMGTLHDYDMQTASGAGGSGQIPVLAVTLRVVDARSGDIVWAANAARRGTDRETVFGIGRIYSLNTLAEEAAADMGRAFAASLRDIRSANARDRSAAAADAAPADAPRTNGAPANAAPTNAPTPEAPTDARRTNGAPANAAPTNAPPLEAPADVPPTNGPPASPAPTNVAPADVEPDRADSPSDRKTTSEPTSAAASNQ